jgi:NAD(P)-dependent dehydrogenase (short-subunit alcohol dehydrogenase family)
MTAASKTRPVACITGGASGIGQAIASLMVDRGHRVIVADIAPGESNSDVVCAPHDVGDEQSWIDLMNKISTEFGGLHVLVNNAGLCINRATTEMTLQSWRRQMTVNLDGTFLGMKHGIPLIASSGGGAIVNIASVAGIRGIPGLGGYCASKAGIIYLGKSAALECAAQRNNIRINTVLPGAIETPIWAKLGNDGDLPASDAAREAATQAQRTAATAATPIGFPGAPLDIAKMVAFLVSDEARFITGAEFIVDGGASAGT